MATSSTEKSLDNLETLCKELTLLHNCCLNNQTSPFRTKVAIKPFQNDIVLHKKRDKSMNRFWPLWMYVSIMILILALVSMESSKRFAASVGRRLLINVLPIIDWTRLHNVGCLLANPLNGVEEEVLTSESCKICVNLTSIPTLTEADMEKIANVYVEKHIPVIVSRLQEPTEKSCTIDDIVKLYLDDMELGLYKCCDFQSNIVIPKGDHRTLLKGVRNSNITEFYAHWQNCFKDAAKLFRKIYQRPDFLPSSVELSSSNWLFVCSNYTKAESIQLPLRDAVIVLIQLVGQIDIKLKPLEPCVGPCKELTASLSEGSTLIVTDYLYEMEYTTCQQDTSITVGLLGQRDI